MRNIIRLLMSLCLFIVSSLSYAVPPYFGVTVEENLSFTALSCLAGAEKVLKDDGFEKIMHSGSTIFAAYRNSNPYQYKAFVKCLSNVDVIMVVVAAPAGARNKAISLMEEIKQSHHIAATNNNGCDAWAYVVDNDPKGLNVRNAPKTGKIISRITKDTRIRIVEANKNGWLKIDRWEDNNGIETKLRKGGWVYGSLVGTSVRGYGKGGAYAYATASEFSDKKGKLVAEGEVTILGCQDEWLHVQGKSADGPTIKGWLPQEEQCPLPFTTCP